MPEAPHKQFKLYLDDSGNKEYSPDGKYPPERGKTPYFVFAGLLLGQGEVSTLPRDLRALKTRRFGTPDIEIKANWLRIDYERKARYLDPYGLNEKQLREFVDDVYNLIASTNLELVGCVVNKVEVQQEYGENAWYAPAIAYECLLQRVQNAMVEKAGIVHVTIDDMTGATPKGSQYRENLERHHRSLVVHGSKLMRGFAFDRLGGQAFSDSSHDERLQLADLVAYAIYRQFVDHGADWEDTTKTALPVYEYLHKISQKFRNQDGRIQGFGIVKFPRKGRILWRVKKKP